MKVDFLAQLTEGWVKKGFIWVLILKLLREQPRHGYELRKEITRRYGNPHPFTFWTMLKLMGRMGLVEQVRQNGSRRVYGITEKGQEILDRAVGHLREMISKLDESVE